MGSIEPRDGKRIISWSFGVGKENGRLDGEMSIFVKGSKNFTAGMLSRDFNPKSIDLSKDHFSANNAGDFGGNAHRGTR